MGKQDTASKEFLSDNNRFADVCNVVLYDGQQVIHAEDLEERDSTEVLSILGVDGKTKEFQQKWRDLLKSAVVRYTGGAYIVLIGLENQTKIHYAMPVKNALYDAMNYGSQVKEAAKKHKANSDRGSQEEFLSGFHKTDRLTPVITITVYWGADNWDAPRSLHEMFGNVDKRLLPFIPDYRINLLVPNEIQNFDQFQTSLGCVLELIKASTDKNATEIILRSNNRYKSLENDAVSMINVFTGTNLEINEKKGVTDMCKAWDDQKKEGRAEGLALGNITAIRNMIDLGLTKDQILKKYSEEEYAKAEESLLVHS